MHNQGTNPGGLTGQTGPLMSTQRRSSTTPEYPTKRAAGTARPCGPGHLRGHRAILPGPEMLVRGTLAKRPGILVTCEPWFVQMICRRRIYSLGSHNNFPSAPLLDPLNDPRMHLSSFHRVGDNEMIPNHVNQLDSIFCSRKPPSLLLRGLEVN